MRNITYGLRLFIGLALVFAVGAVVAPATATAQNGGTAYVEIHNRICPPGYDGDNFFEDCHDNPPDPGLPFSLSNDVQREGTTDAAGNVVFGELPEGVYTIVGGAPLHSAEMVVVCSFADDIESPAEFGRTNGAIDLFVPADTGIVCDWYNIPMPGIDEGTGRVELHKGLCPPGYTGDDFIRDCFDGNRQPGVLFSLDGLQGTTGEGGVVAFEGLVEATYTIIEHDYVTDFVVSCALAEPAVPPVDFTYIEGGISLFVPEGLDIICHWANIPADPVDPAPTPAPPVDDVPRLPDVGTGTMASGSQGGSTALTLIALLTAAIALAGFGVNRRLVGVSAR